MPKEAIIQNDTRRAVAIAIVMACVLAASMAVATAMSATTHRPRRTLAQLSLHTPEGWQQREPNPAVPGLNPQTVLQDPAHPHRVLLIGATRLRVPQSAIGVLRVMLTRLPSPTAQAALRDQPMQTFRIGDLQGAGVVASAEADGQLQHHHVAVLTRDGRRHWVLYLAAAHLADEGPTAAVYDQVLFHEILKSVRLPDTDTN